MSKTSTTDVVTSNPEDLKIQEYVPFGGKDKIKLSIAMIQNLIAVKTRNGHTCSKNDAIKFMAMCIARKLNPWEGDAFLIGYDGSDGPTFSLITAHQAFLKRAELNPEYNGMKSGVMVIRDKQLVELEGDFHLDSDTLVGGWACVYFKNREHPMFKRVKLSRFNTGKSIWLKDPAGMVCKVAEADALRSSFPTMLGGLYMKEEIDKPEEEEVKIPIFKSATTIASSDTRRIQAPPTPLSDLRALCVRDGVEESKLVGFMVEIGLASGSPETLEDIASVESKPLEVAIQNWDDISKKTKESK